MSEYQLIHLEAREGVAVLTLNRPEKRNAISDDMRTELIGALESIAANREIRALVLTGNGKASAPAGT